MSVQYAFDTFGDDIAAVIVEPVAGNMGVVPPIAGFLEGLREITKKHGSLLIFDEVMTGFRVGYHCAQGTLGVTPDLTCLGKVIGGGLPVGAFGGKREIMEQIAPSGDVPSELQPGFTIGAVPEREDPRDAFISNDHIKLADLPSGSIIGTSSLRRSAQILS